MTADGARLDELLLEPADARVLRTNLFCVWSISFLSAIDGTVAVPSLWRYIESLGGSEEYYGLCVSAFAVARVAFMGVFGLWVGFWIGAFGSSVGFWIEIDIDIDI